MAVNARYTEKCDWYRDKCKQHLQRTCLAWSLALKALAPSTGPPAGDLRLAQEALDIPIRDEREARLALNAVVARTHFLLLKVEFEFFLSWMTRCLWEHHAEEVLPRAMARQGAKPQAFSDRRLREFADAVARGSQAKRSALRKVIPALGLDRFERVLEVSIGSPLPGLFREEDSCCWSQIRSAFQVRHQIEHVNGKVTQCFRSRVMDKEDWKKSSWEGYSLPDGAKIPIQEDDFAATFSAMERATDVIAERLRRFPP